MNLTLETSLHGVVRALEERIGPALSDPFAQETARLARLMLSIVANAVDGAAAIRVTENGAIRALFRDAAGLCPHPLADEIGEAGASVEQGYRISELDRENQRLRALLVKLHAVVEQQPDPAARAMDARIWRLLEDVEVARMPRA